MKTGAGSDAACREDAVTIKNMENLDGMSDWFSTFCGNLQVQDGGVISVRYKAITRRLNTDFWTTTSDTAHTVFVGQEPVQGVFRVTAVRRKVAVARKTVRSLIRVVARLRGHAG